MRCILNVKAVGIELTSAIRSYVEEKITAVEKFTDPKDSTLSVNVEIGKTTKHHNSGNVFKAEAHVHTSHGNFDAVSEKDDLYAAIDAMKDELERELTSHKDKYITMRNRGGRSVKDVLRGMWPF